MRSLLAILTGAIVAMVSRFVVGLAAFAALGPARLYGFVGFMIIILFSALTGGWVAGTIARREELASGLLAGVLFAGLLGARAWQGGAEPLPLTFLLTVLPIVLMGGAGGLFARWVRSRELAPEPEPATRLVSADAGTHPRRRSMIALLVGFAVADGLALAVFLGSRALLGRFLDGDPPDVRFLDASVAARHAAAPFGALVGGFLAARLAPARRLGHAAALGVAIALTSLIGLLALFHRVPTLDRRLLILVLPVLAAILGGALARPRKETT